VRKLRSRLRLCENLSGTNWVDSRQVYGTSSAQSSTLVSQRSNHRTAQGTKGLERPYVEILKDEWGISKEAEL